MKHLILASACALLLVTATGSALAQEQQMTPEQQAAMEAMMKAATPGQPHKLLEQQAGVWDMVSYSHETGQKMETGRGTSTRTMILGGRFLQDHTEAEMMGMRMEGWGLTGYNNLTGEYEGTWIDNLGTALYVTKGKASDDGKSIVQYMDYLDPITGKTTKMKMVSLLESEDLSRFTWYIPGAGKDGGDLMTMEMVYTRKK